jgi:hypothetical protein
MNADQERSEREPAEIASRDGGWHLSAISERPGGHAGKRVEVTYTYTCKQAELEIAVEHDREKRVFRLTGVDEKTEVFRAHAVRNLEVEPDAETGEWMPVIREGEPRISCLCREERE